MENKENVRFFRQTRATRLIADKSGTVVGIEVKRIPPGLAAWRHKKAWKLASNIVAASLGLSGQAVRPIAKIEQEKARTLRIRVRKGVVLSAGGFIHNSEMLAKTAPCLSEIPSPWHDRRRRFRHQVGHDSGCRNRFA